MLNRSWLLAVAAAYLFVFLLQVQCTPARRPAQSVLVVEQLAPEDGVVDLREDGGTPVRRGIPPKPSEWQKTPPCDPELGEVLINGACYIELKKRPPCGRTLEHGAGCFRPVAKLQREPSSIQR